MSNLEVKDKILIKNKVSNDEALGVIIIAIFG